METSSANKELSFVHDVDLGEFARKAAHDIANPINAILMKAELAIQLLKRNQVGGVEENLAMLIGDCKRIARLLRHMGKFGSDLEAGVSARTELSNLIEDAVGAATMEGVQIPGEMDIDVSGITLFADGAALQRVVIELLRNAAEAGATSIKIRAIANDGAHLITFCDNGSGIEDHQRDNVFNAFFTTRQVTRHSGLGLTLILALMTRHAGSVQIESSDGSGTCIALRFPVAQATGAR